MTWEIIKKSKNVLLISAIFGCFLIPTLISSGGCAPASTPPAAPEVQTRYQSETIQSEQIQLDQSRPERDQPEPNQIPKSAPIQSQPEQSRPQPTQTVTSLAQRFGQISPRELDDSLNDEQLTKMLAPPREIPLVELWKEAEPNQVAPPAEVVSEPNSIAGRKAYLQGRRLLIEGQYIQSRAQVLKGLRVDPNSAALYELLSQAQMNLGDRQAAALSARRALELDGNRLKALQLLGGHYTNQGEYLAAVSAFQRALTCPDATPDNPVTAVLYLQLAEVLEQIDYLNAAVRYYDIAYQMLKNQSRFSQANPLISRLVQQRHMYVMNIAVLEVRMGRMAQAMKALQLAQKDLVEGAGLMRGFILSLAKQRLELELRYRQVTAFCRYLLAIDYQTEITIQSFHEACRTMARENDFPEVLSVWYETLGGEPQERLLTAREYAYGLVLANRDEQAQKILTQQLAVGQELSLVHRDLGTLYKKQQQWREVVIHFGEYLQSDADVAEDVLEQFDQIKGQIPQLNSKLEEWRRDEQLIEAYGSVFLLGYLARQQGEDELAEWFYRRSLELMPKFRRGRNHLIELLLKRKKAQEVLDWIEQNADNKQPDPDIMHYAGRAYVQLGQWLQAADYLRRFIELRPDDVNAYLALAEVLAQHGDLAQAEEILLGISADQPAQLGINQQLLLLYARWTAQDNLDDQFLQAAQKRARQMLNSWLLRSSMSERAATMSGRISARDRQQLLTSMEELAEEYPHTPYVSIMLSQIYFNQGRTDLAVERIERVLIIDPNEEEALTLGVWFNESAGNPKRVAQLRRRLWRLHEDDPQIFAQALGGMWVADETAEALELLLSVAEKESYQNTNAIEILHPDALRLFMVTRQYASAVDLLWKWYDFLIADDEDKDRPPQDTDTSRRVGEGLIWALTEAGMFEQAIQHTRSLHQRYQPSQARMALYLSNTLNVRFQYEKSQSLLEELVELQPKDLALRMQWCYTMIEQGQTDAAEESIRQWVDRQPNQKQRQNALVLLLLRAGDYEGAAEQLRQYLKADPLDETMQLNLVDALLRAGDYEQAELTLFRSEAKKKQTLAWLNMQMNLDIAQGDWKIALTRIDDLARGSTSPQIELLKVQLLQAAGETAQAVERLEKIITRNPQDPEDLNRRIQYSLLLERLGEPNAMIGEMESLMQDYPDNSLVKNNLGYTLIEAHRDIQRAGRLVEESLRADPESAATLDSVGWFYYKKGEFDRALEYIYQSAARTPDPDPDILCHLGDAMYRLGQEQQAREYWSQGLEALQDRLPFERFLETLREKLETRLRQLEAGEEVTVAELFKRL